VTVGNSVIAVSKAGGGSCVDSMSRSVGSVGESYEEGRALAMVAVIAL
jgi:hypothetical protein